MRRQAACCQRSRDEAKRSSGFAASGSPCARKSFVARGVGGRAHPTAAIALPTFYNLPGRCVGEDAIVEARRALKVAIGLRPDLLTTHPALTGRVVDWARVVPLRPHCGEWSAKRVRRPSVPCLSVGLVCRRFATTFNGVHRRCCPTVLPPLFDPLFSSCPLTACEYLCRWVLARHRGRSRTRLGTRSIPPPA